MTTLRKISAISENETTYSRVTDETVEQFTQNLPKDFVTDNASFTIEETVTSVDDDGEKLCVWKFYWNVGRMGSLESYFVASQKKIDSIVGKNIYFGEVLGKHSEVEGTLEKDEFTLISQDANIVAFFKEVIGSTGHNPIQYLEEMEEEEEDYDEEDDE